MDEFVKIMFTNDSWINLRLGYQNAPMIEHCDGELIQYIEDAPALRAIRDWLVANVRD